MSEWKPLSQIAKVRRGASPRPISDPRYFGGDVGWVRIVDVTRSSRYLRKTEQYLSKLGESRSVRVDKGDLVMSICGTIGRPIMIDMAACIHDGFVQLYDVTDADTEYLFYSLQFSEDALIAKGQPGTQVNLNTDIVGKHLIFAPQPKEQRKIAKILSTVDNLIEKTQALIDKYQSIKQGMMHDLFTRGVDKHGQLRPSYEDAPHLYKESELGWIPKEWKVEPFSSFITNHQSGIYKKRELFGEGSNIVGVSELYKVSSISGQIFKLVPLTLQEKDKFSLMDGDLIYGESSLVLDGIAKTLWVTNEGEGTAFAWHTRRVSVDKGRLTPQYLYYFLNAHRARRYVMSVATQTALTGITTKAYFSTPIFVPGVREQETLSERIGNVDINIERQKEYLEKIIMLKSGLMQDLLTGKVRVKFDA